MKGYGVADIEKNTPVNSETSIFRIASISKTFVGTAIMQLVEERELQLDEDINQYLKSFQLDYKFGAPITIKHLLTHTAGFDDRNIATSVRTEDEVISLAQYVEQRIPPQIRPAGEVLTYSNQGYALLGLIVEEVSGLPFDEYVTKRILEPLEMNSSGFRRHPELKNNYALSYLHRDGQLIPYELDYPLDYPAGSFSSTAADMAHYISMYLNYGNYHGTQFLDSTTVALMHKTAFKHYDEAEDGWLLGFNEYRWNGLKVVRHSGQIQGFSGELLLIPEKNIGVFMCVNAESIPDNKSQTFMGLFINKLWLKVMPEILAKKEPPKVIPQIGSAAEPLATISGKYRYTRYPQKTLDKLAVFVGFAPEVNIVSKGDTLEIVEWNDKLIPISDLTFYSTTYHTYRGFGRNSKGEIDYFFPVGTYAYHRLSWYEPMNFQMYWIAMTVLILLSAIIVGVIRKLFVRHKKSSLLKKIIFPAAILIILFLSLTTYVLINTDPQEFFYGIPVLLKITLVLPFLFLPLELYAVWLLIKAWRLKELGTFDLIYQSIIVIAVLAFIPWLMYWNLIGFNY
jgi:CubicO group peptidase (beta-lactamase class C family)